jgi:hypothetical protein
LKATKSSTAIVPHACGLLGKEYAEEGRVSDAIDVSIEHFRWTEMAGIAANYPASTREWAITKAPQSCYANPKKFAPRTIKKSRRP